MVLENVKDRIDEAKDKVEEETGLDIDRDGNVGNEEPDNTIDAGSPPSNDSSNQSGDAGVDVDVSDEVQVDTDEGSSTFDIGDADGGSNDRVEVDPTDPTPTSQRNDGVEVIDSPSSNSSSNSSSSSSNSGSSSPSKNNKVRNSEEEEAERQINKELKQAEEAEKRIQEQLTDIKSAEKNRRYEVDSKTAKQIKKSQGKSVVQDQTIEADNLQSFLTSQQKQIETQQNELQDFQTVIEEEEVQKFEQEDGEFLIEFAGEPEQIEQEPNFADNQDLQEAEGFGRRRDIAGEIMIAEGLKGLEERQEQISERDRVTAAEGLGNAFAIAEEAVTGEGGVFQALTDEERRENINQRAEEFTEDAELTQAAIERPDKTGLVVFGGTTRAVGSISNLTPDDREINIAESAGEFAASQKEFAQEDPGRFAGQVATDFGLAAAATKGARASTRAARAARSGDIDFSRGTATVDPFQPARPGPRTRVGPSSQDRVDIDIDERTVTPDTPETDVLVTGGARNNSTGRTNTGTDTVSRDIDETFGVTRPEPITRSRTDKQSDILSRGLSRNQSQTQSRSTSDAVTRATADVDRFFARPRPRARRGRGRTRNRRRRLPPFGGFPGNSDSNSEEEEIQGVFAAPESNFQPSLDAVLTGETGEVDTSQELTGFETRPIPETNSNGNNNNDLDLFT